MLTYEEKRSLTDGICDSISSDIYATDKEIKHLTDAMESEFDKIHDKLDGIANQIDGITNQINDLALAAGLMDLDENGNLVIIDRDEEELEELYKELDNQSNNDEF